MNPYYASLLTYAGINMILVLGLQLCFGFAGMFSLGHAGFMALGAYFSASISSMILQPWLAQQDLLFLTHLCFLFLLLLSGLVCVLVSNILGRLTLHLHGDYFAMVTLGFGEIIRVILLNFDFLGGPRGLTGIPMWNNLFATSLVLILVSCLLYKIKNSEMGRAFIAIKDDELAARLLGLAILPLKQKALNISAFICGIAGGLFAHTLTYINPKIFDFSRSVEIVVMLILGGLGSLTGCLVSALGLTLLREILRPLQLLTGTDLRLLFYAVLLILSIVLRQRKNRSLYA